MGKSSLIKSTTKNKRLSDKSQKKDRAEIEKIDVKLNEHIAVVEEIEEGKNEQIGIQGDPKSDIITSFNYFNDETINNLDESEPALPLIQKAPETKVYTEVTETQCKIPPKKEPAINDSQLRIIKTSINIVAFLILIVIAASISNFNTYFIERKNDGIEVWKGKFSPMGKSFLMSLPDAKLLESTKTTGPKKVIFPLIFDYFLQKADSSLKANKIPDFEQIHSYLLKARSFAATQKQKHDVAVRINGINLTVLLYKAEIGINEHTEAVLKKALGFLEEAKKLSLDDIQKELVNKKIHSIVRESQKAGTP